MIPPLLLKEYAGNINQHTLLTLCVLDALHRGKEVVGMIPTTCFSAVSLRWLDNETAEFLSEMKGRFDLKSSVLLKRVVG